MSGVLAGYPNTNNCPILKMDKNYEIIYNKNPNISQMSSIVYQEGLKIQMKDSPGVFPINMSDDKISSYNIQYNTADHYLTAYEGACVGYLCSYDSLSTLSYTGEKAVPFAFDAQYPVVRGFCSKNSDRIPYEYFPSNIIYNGIPKSVTVGDTKNFTPGFVLEEGRAYYATRDYTVSGNKQPETIYNLDTPIDRMP